MECQACHDLNDTYWSQLPFHPISPVEDSFTYAYFRRTAEQGCAICRVLVRGMQRVVEAIDDTSAIWLKIKPPQVLSLKIFSHNNGDNDDYTILDVLEFYTLEGSICPWPAFGKSEHVSDVLTLDNAWIRIVKWVSHCNNNHEGCQDLFRTPSLPHRILHIDPNVCEDSIVLEEIEDGMTGRYVTLSHCWGMQRVITTTMNTLAERKAGIPLSDLPPTFQDAVQLTRRLGVKYLWIDSICILQDDISDWEKESALMGSIYSSSYLNIAATHSGDSRGGLFSRRWVPSYCDVSEQLPSELDIKTSEITGKSPSENTGIYVRRSLDHAHEEISKFGSSGYGGGGYGWRPYTNTAPLLSRAWAFQERILSNRIIHFHASEMFWDCKSAVGCECTALGLLPSPSFRPSLFERSAASLATQWQVIIRKYSPLTVTVGADKLPALSGIAERFSWYVNSPYLAGLWENHLPQELLWTVDWSPLGGTPTNSVFIPVRSQPFRAPTWSWASLDLTNSEGRYGCPVRWSRNEVLLDPRFEILRARCVVDGDNPFGRVSFGVLEVKGAFLTPDPELTEAGMHSRSYKLFFSKEEQQYVAFFADTPSLVRYKRGVPSTQPRPVFKVLIIGSFVGMVIRLVAEEVEAESRAKTTTGLGIKNESKKGKYYERVGLLRNTRGLKLSEADEGLFYLI